MRPLKARLTQAHRGSEHHFTQACRARILSSSIRVCAPHGTTSAAVCPVRLRHYSGGDHDSRCDGDRDAPLRGMVIRLGAGLFDHAASRGVRFAVHSALCPGVDGAYWRRRALTQSRDSNLRRGCFLKAGYERVREYFDRNDDGSGPPACEKERGAIE